MDSLPTLRPEEPAPPGASFRAMSERAAQADAEIGHTSIGPRTAWALVAVFLVTIFAVPVVEVVRGVGGAAGTDGPLASLFGMRPAAEEMSGSAAASFPRRIVLRNRHLLQTLDVFETRLEDDSVVAGIVRPWTQTLLTSWLGAGNEEVYPGREGWLFHRPAIDYATGPGFLDPAQLDRRAASGDEWNPPPSPDPRAAILHFQEQLAGRGIALVVVPAPVKPIVHPERFSSRYDGYDMPVQNASFERFRAELEAAGVLVFDPAPLLVEERHRTGRPQFLATDTHWRPEAVERVAESLAAFVVEHVSLPERAPHGYRARAIRVSGRGDLVRMLDLPETQRRFPPEDVSLRSVTEGDGTPWRADPEADVLLLGDSFTNIYSLDGLGWGTGAGLAEQLSLALDRPVDRIARNDAGAYATREMLAREIARGRDRLAGRRVVIYQFAARELTAGDWKRIDLPAGAMARDTDRFLAPETGAEWTAEGRVAAVAPVPRPGTVPYSDHITAVHLTGVRTDQTGAEETEAVVYVWGMRDDTWEEAARWRSGQRVRLRIRPWAEVASRLEGLNRSELPDADFELVEPWWVEEVLP